MPRPFFDRLQEYFANVSAALKSESAAAAVFPNAADIGSSRERVYFDFLKTCLPSACNVLAGGFVFNQEGQESRQIDLIVTADTCPQFNFHNRGSFGKSFCCIDGTLAVVSVKSFLDRSTLHDAISNLASLPPKSPLTKEVVNPFVSIPDYEDWPFKIVFASDGVAEDAIEDALFDYFENNRTRVFASPNLIHVAGKYSLNRIGSEPRTLGNGQIVPPHAWVTESDPTDAGALARVITEIQGRLTASRHIVFDYQQIVGSFTIPVPSLEYIVRTPADYFPERPPPEQKPIGTLAVGTKVRMIEKYGEYCLVVLDDGTRVQLPTRSLRAVSEDRTPASSDD